MTALAGPRAVNRLDGDGGAIPDIGNLPVKANTFVHQGGLVLADIVSSSTYAAPGRTGVGLTVVGVSLDECDNTTATTGGAAGAIGCQWQAGAFPFTNSSAGDAITNANIGQPCYMVDDQTVALTDGNGTRSFAGWIKYVSVAGQNGGPNIGDGSNDGRVYVQVGTDYIHPGINPSAFNGVISFAIDLAQIANGNIITWPAGAFPWNGRIRNFFATVATPATTASKLATLTPSIGGVALTGGVLSLTSANMTPMGATVQSTAITGANTFAGATQALTLAASAVTAFVEGKVNLYFVLG